MTAARADDSGSTTAADAMQAAYFRDTLAEEREHTNRQVGKHREEMARRAETGSRYGIPHLKSHVRALEAELRYLDGLIAKLDRRFSALWVARS